MADKVQCVPGGHQVPVDKAYWCSSCQQYICYEHLRHAIMTTEVKCPRGHAVSKAR